MQLEVNLLSSDVFSCSIKLVGKIVRIPRKHFRDDNIAPLRKELCKILKILAFYDLEKRGSMRSCARYPTENNYQL